MAGYRCARSPLSAWHTLSAMRFALCRSGCWPRPGTMRIASPRWARSRDRIVVTGNTKFDSRRIREMWPPRPALAGFAGARRHLHRRLDRGGRGRTSSSTRISSCAAVSRPRAGARAASFGARAARWKKCSAASARSICKRDQRQSRTCEPPMPGLAPRHHGRAAPALSPYGRLRFRRRNPLRRSRRTKSRRTRSGGVAGDVRSVL